MDQSAGQAHIVEQSTENSWQFVVLLTALTSGIVKEDGYEIRLHTGKSFRVPQGKSIIHRTNISNRRAPPFIGSLIKYSGLI